MKVNLKVHDLDSSSLFAFSLKCEMSSFCALLSCCGHWTCGTAKNQSRQPINFSGQKAAIERPQLWPSWTSVPCAQQAEAKKRPWVLTPPSGAVPLNRNMLPARRNTLPAR
jgi:hypothetical protein